MRTITIRFRGNREQARAAIVQMVKDFSRAADHSIAKRRLGANVSAMFYRLVSESFHNLSTTRRDHNMNVGWEPCSKETMAYSRGTTIDRAGGGFQPTNEPGGPAAYGAYGIAGQGELTMSEIELWWKWYRRLLSTKIGKSSNFNEIKEGMSKKQLSAYWKALHESPLKFTTKKRRGNKGGKDIEVKTELYATKDVKILAAQGAYSALKAKAGYRTKLETLGTRPHEVLNETGALKRSFIPTAHASLHLEEYTPGENQHVKVLPRHIEVGSELPRAAAHHHGTGDAYKPIKEVTSKARGEAKEGELSESATETVDRKPRRFWPDGVDFSSTWRSQLAHAVALTVEHCVTDMQS
jgi:hypothetical protein